MIKLSDSALNILSKHLDLVGIQDDGILIFKFTYPPMPNEVDFIKEIHGKFAPQAREYYKRSR